MQTFEERLLEAIRKDNKKAFDALMREFPCGALRLGRFPVLSLLYLFRARKILSAYEGAFLKISVWEERAEPASLSAAFSARAGKCLRLYFYETVTPLEMLLILDDTRKVKKLYPDLKTSEAVKERLKKIYRIKYALEPSLTSTEARFPRHRRNRRERKKLFYACVGGVLAIALIVAIPITAVALSPDLSKGEVTKLRHIDFSSENTYTLLKDVVIPDNYKIDEMNCTIVGGKGGLILGRNASLGKLNGSLENLEIKTFGDPIFTICAPDSSITDVTLTVEAEAEIDSDSSFLTLDNFGTIEGVKLNVKGSVKAKEGETAAGEARETIFGGLAATNDYTAVTTARYTFGTIKNCEVNYENLILEGETAANATFGGIAGVNNGVIENCKVRGSVSANTFDLGGVCYVNANEVRGVVNEADFRQVAADEAWTPIVAGIVLENAGQVETCQNRGNLQVEGEDILYCGGIAARTYGSIESCFSSGRIFVRAKTAYAGGIFGASEVTTNDRYVYFGTANGCLVTGEIEGELGEGESYVGGIGGFVQEAAFMQYQTDEKGNPVIGTVYWGGGVTDCIFMGSIKGEFSHRGSLIGVCGANIYEANSYFSNGQEIFNFDGNYYLKSALPAFGATVDANKSFRSVEGKGCVGASKKEIEKSELYLSIKEKLE